MKDHIERSIKALLASDRGRQALRHLQAFLDKPCMGSLDSNGVTAVVTLIGACYGPICGTAREMIDDTLDKISLNEV